MRSRTGYTLIELCVTMSVGSALMVLAVGLVHQALSLASTARSRADQHRTFDRLAHDFREDIHLAVAATANDPQRLELTRDGGAIVLYESVDVESDRIRIRREQRVDGTIVRQEDYQIDSSLVVAFEALEQPARVSVRFASESTPIGRSRVPSRQVTAVLGRRLAHQRAEVSP